MKPSVRRAVLSESEQSEQLHEGGRSIASKMEQIENGEAFANTGLGKALIHQMVAEVYPRLARCRVEQLMETDLGLEDRHKAALEDAIAELENESTNDLTP